MGYDSVLRCSVWEYRTDIGIKYFSLVHAYGIIIIVEYLDCDFVGVIMVFRMGVEWLGEKHALNMRCSG